MGAKTDRRLVAREVAWMEGVEGWGGVRSSSGISEREACGNHEKDRPRDRE